MSSDEKSGSQRAIKQPQVLPGPLADLKELLYQLYLEAGTPRLNQIEKWAAMAGQAGMPGRDTIARIIGSATMPPSQADLVAVVTVLARAAGGIRTMPPGEPETCGSRPGWTLRAPRQVGCR